MHKWEHNVIKIKLYGLYCYWPNVFKAILVSISFKKKKREDILWKFLLRDHPAATFFFFFFLQVIHENAHNKVPMQIWVLVDSYLSCGMKFLASEDLSVFSDWKVHRFLQGSMTGNNNLNNHYLFPNCILIFTVLL